MNPTARRVRALLDELGVGAGALVYLHTSFSRLAHLELTPVDLIHGLVDHLGPHGTLVMPSFAWHRDKSARPWKGYADYYRDRPPFDVRHTPANIGVVPECFRSYPGVMRSAHFWWSVAARGPLAETITSGQQYVVNPYGQDSAFGRMHLHGAIILGLGVTLNTTSLAPVVDHEIGAGHTQVVFSPGLEGGVVVDGAGDRVTTRAYWLLPEVVRLIKPSSVVARSNGLNGHLRRADHDAVIQFAYPFRAYFASAMSLGMNAAAHQQRMPWLEDYGVMQPR